MGGNEAVAFHERGTFGFLEVQAELVHLFLELFGIILKAHLDIPGIFRAAVGRGDVFPTAFTFLLNVFDERSGFRSGGFEFRMCCRKNKQMNARYDVMGQRRPCMFSWRRGMSTEASRGAGSLQLQDHEPA